MLQKIKSLFKKKEVDLKKLPVIKVIKVRADRTKYVKMHLQIDDTKWFDKVCDIARREIPNGVLFNWWLTEALKETAARKKEEKRLARVSKKVKKLTSNESL